ncbi:IS3 family transposase [Paraburkholderia fynbosensis]|uniref:IS3 family transposase n=1 Tax=Paraburkholderia fynbosensis TaxID=1200993 RepID=UPI003CCD6882
MHAQLAREGVHVGPKRVVRHMRMAGLCGASRRRWPRATRPRAGGRRAPDLQRRGRDRRPAARPWTTRDSSLSGGATPH